MFETQNLFKSIQCPHYSNATNVFNCDRVYCPFRHTILPQPSTNLSSAPVSTLTSNSTTNTSSQQQQQQQQQDTTKKTQIELATNKSSNQSENNESTLLQTSQLVNTPNQTNTLVTQLPNALENLTNALHTFQELLKQQNQQATTDTSSTSNSTDINSTIVNQLNNLSNVIRSTVPAVIPSTSNTNLNSSSSTPNESTAQIKKQSSSSSSSLSNLKRQQSFPDYNPTPINQLKKLKHETSVDASLTSTSNGQLKRKDLLTSSESLDDILIITDTKQHENNSSSQLKKLKAEPEIIDITGTSSSLARTSSGSSLSQDTAATNESTTSSSTSTTSSAKPKCDLVSFSKLSLSQQVLKRYEMLNKEPPTSAAINQAKLKKKLNQNEGSSQADKKQLDPNIPHLIMDTASNSSLRVPLVMRQRYLKVIFDNCKPLYQPIKTACDKAAENEKSIYDRSKNKQIYTNLAANLIKSLRSEQVQLQAQTSQNKKPIQTSSTSTKLNNLQKTAPKPQVQSYSHEAMLNGSRATKVSYSINRVKQLEFKDLSVTQLYQMFYAYILSEKQLEENSFPKWLNPDETNLKNRLAYIPNFTAQIKNSTEKKSTNQIDSDSKLLTKTCKRCTKNFYLNSKDLTYSSENSECVYHWGKLRNVRVNKAIEQKYSCCSASSNSDGCEEGKHVYDGEYDGNGLGTNLTEYVETQQASTPLDLLNSKSSKNVYALDCEMCYTTKGLEVTRVSIVDINSKPVYESLVKPDAQILDYNTRWSGLTESSLKNCTKKLKHVQQELLKLFNTDTILIGHSLDSDFKALKLIHKNVVDTSVVFPHKMGPPLKRALRNLMSEYLQRIIQEDSDGHDSKEDATACIQLMVWKINEDLKSNKPPTFLANSSTTSTTATTTITNQSNYRLNNLTSTNTTTSQSNAIKESPNKMKQQQQQHNEKSNLLLSQVKAKIAETSSNNNAKQKQAHVGYSSTSSNLNLINSKTNVSTSFKIINKF